MIDDRNEAIADYLEIDVEELASQHFEIELNASDDDHPYNYFLKFTEGTPEEFLARLPDRRGNTVYIPLYVIDHASGPDGPDDE